VRERRLGNAELLAVGVIVAVLDVLVEGARRPAAIRAEDLAALPLEVSEHGSKQRDDAPPSTAPVKLALSSSAGCFATLQLATARVEEQRSQGMVATSAGFHEARTKGDTSGDTQQQDHPCNKACYKA
jgi:hypothetical protein